MRVTHSRLALVIGVLIATTFSARADLFGDETPPANAKPLSNIIKLVEDHGYKTITEVEFEDGKWRIEAHQANGKEINLAVDAVTGQISPDERGMYPF